MIINPANTPPTALPPSVKGGGNAPSKRPSSGDPFASVIAQISGAGEAGRVGNTTRGSVSLASRKRGIESLEDVGASVVPSKHDADDPMFLNVAVPAWLWTVQEQPGSLGSGAVAAQQTAGGSGSAGGADTVESAGSTDAPRIGPVAVLASGMGTVPLFGAASQDGSASVQTDQTDQLSSSAIAAQAGGQSTSGLPAGVDGVSPALTSPAAAPAGGPVAPAERSAGSAVQTEATDPQNVSSPSADQPGSVQSRIPARRGGRMPAAYADAANEVSAQALSPAGQPANGVASPPPSASSAQAGSSRITDHLRASTDRANGGAVRAAGSPTVLADGQAALTAGLLTGRAQSGAAQNPADQDSSHSSTDSRGGAEDIQALAAQSLDASVAQAVDAALVGTAARSDHGILQAGQAANTHVQSPDGTTAAAASPLLSGIAERSAAIDDASLHRQMVQAIHLQSRNGVGDARITLQPEYLGEVTIALRVEDGGVTAHVSAASTQVREWLGAHESMLRHGLAEQGLTLDRLVVSEEPSEPSRESRGGNARQQQSQEDQEPRPRPRRETSTFEITL